MKGAADSDGRWEQIWTVFHDAIERPEPERAAFLDRACERDPELRREVEELLAAHDEGLPLLDESLPADFTPTVPAEEELFGGVSLRPGAVLANRFEIVGRIAVGGMGEVYEAHDRELDRKVALKTLIASRARSASALARFRREIHLSQQVTHRNVCRIFDLVRDGDLVFLTMELLGGETLAARLHRDGALSLDETKRILEQVVSALEAAHAVGVIHRDLKPSNIMLVEDPDGLRVVVTDFGLATSGSSGSEEESHLTKTGEMLGTPAYMAPEQLEGNEVGPATDVYALGLVLYEMVTAHRPFTGRSTFSLASRRLEGPPSSPREHVPELDRRWERVILRCLERDPEDRFQQPREIVEALDDESIRLRARWGIRRNRRAAFALAASVLSLFVAMGLWWRFGTEPRSPSAERSAVKSGGLAFEERDAVIVAAFDNRTGDSSLDGVLGVALARELSSSTFINVASRGRMTDSLQLMRLPADSVVDLDIARHVALRDGNIRVIVAGIAEKIGGAFVITVNLIAPGDDQIIASWSENVGDEISGISAALRGLAFTIREYLGENPEKIAASSERLVKVTTPSLRALRLYDEADAAITRGRSDVAEELLREAIREDPDFASAHNLLAWTIRNQGRAAEEFVPHAKRAMELSEGVPDRERYFIRASYFGFMGDRDREVNNLQALLRLHPDHLWANHNIAVDLDSAVAVPYRVRAAESRPRSLLMNFFAAHALAITANRPLEAQRFIDRVNEIVAAEIDRPWQHAPFPAWALLWKAHRHWVLGNVDEAKAELDRRAEELGRFSGSEQYFMRQFLIRGYRNLGMADRAFDLATPAEFRTTRPFLRGVDACLSGDYERALEHFTAEVWQDQTERDIFRAPLRIACLARSGRRDEAAAIFASYVEKPSPDFRRKQSVALESRLAGEMMLAEGRYQDAIDHLEREAFRDESTRWGLTIERYGASYFLAAQALAIAYRELGRDEDAVAILEQAVAERARSYPNGTEAWMDTQLRLAVLYRELGHTAKAERLEAELRDLMRFADDDFWLLRRLQEQTRDRARTETEEASSAISPSR